jgi:hypothetical protein
MLKCLELANGFEPFSKLLKKSGAPFGTPLVEALR